MLGVYNYMATALGVTGLFAFGTKMMAVTTGPDGQLYAQASVTCLNTPLMWVVALAPLGMVFWLSSRLHAMSLTKAQTCSMSLPR